MLLSDFDGEGFVSLKTEGYQTITIYDVEYENNPGEILEIIVKDGDSYEYIREIIANRKQLPVFNVRTAKEESTKIKAIEALATIKTKENLFKKIKSSIVKFSCDKDFPYRQVADLIKNMPFVVDVDESRIDTVDYLNSERINDFIISQTIHSLETYTMVHPKIKILMNEVGKESVLSLSFEIEE